MVDVGDDSGGDKDDEKDSMMQLLAQMRGENREKGVQSTDVLLPAPASKTQLPVAHLPQPAREKVGALLLSSMTLAVHWFRLWSGHHLSLKKENI